MGSYIGDIPVEKEPPRTSLNMQGQEGASDLLSRYVLSLFVWIILSFGIRLRHPPSAEAFGGGRSRVSYDG